jgi:hypothetical protein
LEVVVEDVTKRRLEILAHGYRPIPINGKAPGFKDWQKTLADEQLIRRWEVGRRGDSNTGILTKHNPAIDIDILVPEAAALIEDLVRRLFADKGKLLCRTGRAPKRAFPFRAEAPFEKQLLLLVAPNEPMPQQAKEVKHRIEILGDGQQIVVDGIHPDTGQPYSWSGGEPWTVPQAELPLLTQAEATALLAEARNVLEAVGWRAFKAPAAENIAANSYPLVVEVAASLWGEPTSHYEDEYRFGSHGSKVVNRRTGMWFDFENNEGGGQAELFKRARAQQPIADNSLMQTSAEFAGDFVPPDYLIDGLLQRRYVYSLTAPTGAGKTSIVMRLAAHVAKGLPLGDREVERGKVLLLAGENPDDVRARWIKLCEEMDIALDAIEVYFIPGVHPIDTASVRAAIDAEAERHGPFSLLIVDTSAAYYSGDDENDNVQLGNHARMLRSFVELPGGPTIIVTCHPTKNPDMANLLPRGGGAFLAEVDGNLVCLKRMDSNIVELSWHGKFRGPDFASIPFKITPGQSDRLKDSKGRAIWTVTAAPVTEQEVALADDAATRHQNQLLLAMHDHPGASIAELARAVQWFTSKGEPNKTLVYRTVAVFKAERLVTKVRDRWTLTRQGEAAVADLANWDPGLEPI